MIIKKNVLVFVLLIKYLMDKNVYVLKAIIILMVNVQYVHHKQHIIPYLAVVIVLTVNNLINNFKNVFQSVLSLKN